MACVLSLRQTSIDSTRLDVNRYKFVGATCTYSVAPLLMHMCTPGRHHFIVAGAAAN